MAVPPFNESEYHARIQKTQRSMLEKGAEVLLITNPANMNYLSGYDGWSFYVHQLLVVTVDAAIETFNIREKDEKG